ncbi:MAG TPA: xanthine dehydrogenase small subunit [Anaeromyxobacter sp.]|nr:xanthine dehydrogenase small subunit [Anaeromyxobacter sp.]
MSGAVRFLLDGGVRSISGIDPTTTVLQWLRGPERRCGTKEGCAEGDCGACTVVLGELVGGVVRLRAVNACLLFLPALDGKALFTVESLRAQGGALHPVQRALVECHGSQCGFCTPGFVMSMFALYESEREPPTRRRVDEVLAGNLCRCTGYRPIVEAVGRAYALGTRDGVSAREGLAQALAGLARERALDLEHGGKRLVAPRSLDELAAFTAAHPEALVLAGGTDLGLLVTKEHRDLPLLVSVGEVPELHQVEESATHLEIGAAATYSEALPALSAYHPSLGALVRRIGSTQIRNAATLGGNVANASPVGDTPPALLALDASVVLRLGAERRELPLSSFFLGYRKTALRKGELLTAIRIPRGAPGREFRAYKVSKRVDQDIAAVCGAFAVEREAGRVRAARVAFGGMAAVPLRAVKAEAELTGRPFGEASVEAAVAALEEELKPISDMRASAAYRRLVAGNLLRKFWLEVAGPGAGEQGGKRPAEVTP